MDFCLSLRRSTHNKFAQSCSYFVFHCPPRSTFATTTTISTSCRHSISYCAYRSIRPRSDYHCTHIHYATPRSYQSKYSAIYKLKTTTDCRQPPPCASYSWRHTTPACTHSSSARTGAAWTAASKHDTPSSWTPAVSSARLVFSLVARILILNTSPRSSSQPRKVIALSGS